MNCENLVGAGRTDAGVHAIGQVAHVDLATKRDCETVQKAINYYLNKYPVSILNARFVNNQFHARFSATKRHYIYKIFPGKQINFEKNQYWHVRHSLNKSKYAASCKLPHG